MPTFSYDITLVTWRDYARWRLDDTDENEPFIWNETYDRLYTMFGPVNGLVMSARVIATILSKSLNSFGEAAGIRFTISNLKYYQELPDIIITEPPYGSGAYQAALARLGKLNAGQIRGCRCAPIYQRETGYCGYTPFATI